MKKKKGEKKVRLRRDERQELVKQEYVRTGGRINDLAFSKKIGCNFKSVAKDVKEMDDMLKKRLVGKYADNILQELLQGQDIVRIIMNESVRVKDENGVPLENPELLCEADVLLDRLLKVGKIRESDAKIMERWSMKEIPQKKTEVTHKSELAYAREAAIAASKKV